MKAITLTTEELGDLRAALAEAERNARSDAKEGVEGAEAAANAYDALWQKLKDFDVLARLVSVVALNDAAQELEDSADDWQVKADGYREEGDLGDADDCQRDADKCRALAKGLYE